ncbi:MAG: hypothetical protein M0P04_09330 [Syntrophales bacterium]|jgi:hypothetical protein|nr:hypothetical protein [Syntrophales bacterium]MDD4339833.1 hypothetical protein [Syntrophales bacterium]HOG08180.1 hypothetical protein [Syntrophales bacterium]HOS77814.1 hypothetical protein [Syntrophales bacterium]HQN26475.1 hypothetical protein [Syntrophales bacterium]
MKKIVAMIVSLLFLVTLSFAVVGCKKAEEQKPEEAATTEAPAPAPAEPAAPEAAPEAAPAAPAEPAAK